MAKTTPAVQFDALSYQQDDQKHLVAVRTEDWYSQYIRFPL